MPRGNRSQLPAVAFSVEHGEEAEGENSMDSSSEEENSNHVEEEVFNDFEIDVDKTSEDGTGSDVVHRVRTVSDEVLTFLGTACMDRMTDSGVQRMICSQPPNVRDEVLHLWKTGFSGLSRHFICNQCGQDVLERTSCCGDVLTYFRVGGYSQLEDITKENLEDILKLRADLRTGKEKNHNLCGDFLKTLWQSENGDMLKISLIGSIDGVSLNGNTKYCEVKGFNSSM
ncbi:hypothetical protein B9Z55_009388 [Caenorhabditis nigoni]|uniref:Uncharacterized protein n=1 Tax=Caenorhabditis nigoni TaxID=1611254 RepID=A0A2G5US25_9PELO|nr:hypothetical protein B9Z55_009388 [Caenorhabditis nigoni]